MVSPFSTAFIQPIAFNLGRSSDMLSLCEVETVSSFQMQYFYEIHKKKMNLFPDTILQVHTVSPERFECMQGYSILAMRLKNSIKHVCIMLTKLAWTYQVKHHNFFLFDTFKVFWFCFNWDNNLNELVIHIRMGLCTLYF